MSLCRFENFYFILSRFIFGNSKVNNTTCATSGLAKSRRVCRYQRGNQNPYIEEEQTTQWQKEKVQNDKQWSTKHRHKTKDRVTRTTLKTGGELRCSGRVSSSCSTGGILNLLFSLYCFVDHCLLSCPLSFVHCILSLDLQLLITPLISSIFPRFVILVFNATFSNISAMSWRPVLVVEETGVPGENHRPWVSNW